LEILDLLNSIELTADAMHCEKIAFMSIKAKKVFVK